MMRYLVVLCLFIGSSISITLPKIIGGENATDAEYPHQVSIRYVNRTHLCGGSIIHEEWVMTAAHCVSWLPYPRAFKIVVGSNTLNPRGDTYNILELHIHESFSQENYRNDIALLKVQKIQFGPKVGKINIEKSFVDGDIPVTIIGWGIYNMSNTVLSNDLKQLALNTTTNEKCKRRSPNPTEMPIDETKICTLHRTRIGPCLADAGGALIRNVDGERYAVGIASRYTVCGSVIFPDVYVRVSAYQSWLTETCNCNL